MIIRKVFSILAAILMPLAVVALVVCPIIVQIGTPDGVFAHIDSLFAGAGEFFVQQFVLLFEGDLFAIASVSTLLVLLIIFVLWIVFAALKKHKSVAAIIFGAINIAIEYFMLLIFVFNTNDIVYKGMTELSNPGYPMFLALQPFGDVFHPIFGYGLFGAFVISGVSFIFVLIAFIGDVASKKTLPPQEEVPQPVAAPVQPTVAPVVQPVQSSTTDDEKLRQIIREELSRHNGNVSEEEIAVAVATPEEHIVEDAQPAEVVEESVAVEPAPEVIVEEPQPAIEEKPAEEPKVEEALVETPSLDGEPKYNRLDPIEKLFAEIESNRPELENPLPKKGEAPTPKLDKELHEEPKEEEMSVEEKMEEGIVDPKVVKESRDEEEDEIDCLEDEHLD